MFRDKRTIFSTILLPFILYPLLFVGTFSLMSRQTAKLEEKGALIALADSVDNTASQIIVRQLKAIPHFEYNPVSEATERMYQDQVVHAVITITDSLQTGGVPVYQLKIKYDKSTDRGKMIGEKINQALKKAEKEILTQRLAERGLNAEFINAVLLNQMDTSSPQKKLGSLLGSILPYLLIMLLIAGASVVAGDLVAGEKERKTLETLLVSSAHRNEIVLGKYLTIITFALINVLVNLISLYFSMRNIASQSGLEMAGVKFPTNGFLLLFLALIPLATLYAALLLSISTFSRNMKEARSYEQPVLLVSMLLAMSSFFPAIELNNGLVLIPVINISLLFKAVMMSDFKTAHLLLTIGSTLLLDIAAIVMTVKLFSTESVLFRSDVDTSLKQLRSNKRAFFTPYYGLIYFVLALLALYYLGGSWQSKEVVSGLFKTQILIILLPVLIIIRLIKADIKTTLKFQPAPWLNIIVVPFIAVSAAIIVTLVGQLINLIYPVPSDYLEKMSELLKMPDLKLWQVLGVIAILPGVCEEILFRGFIYRFYQNGSKWMPILVSALLFAVFHLDPYRFVPVLLLGLLLGWMLYKSGSIFVTMYSHTLNNAVAVLLMQYSGHGIIKQVFSSGDEFKWWLGIPAFAILVIALYLFSKVNKPQNRLSYHTE